MLTFFCTNIGPTWKITKIFVIKQLLAKTAKSTINSKTNLFRTAVLPPPKFLSPTLRIRSQKTHTTSNIRYNFNYYVKTRSRLREYQQFARFWSACLLTMAAPENFPFCELRLLAYPRWRRNGVTVWIQICELYICWINSIFCIVLINVTKNRIFHSIYRVKRIDWRKSHEILRI